MAPVINSSATATISEYSEIVLPCPTVFVLPTIRQKEDKPFSGLCYDDDRQANGISIDEMLKEHNGNERIPLGRR
jgi:hypothetical protein